MKCKILFSHNSLPEYRVGWFKKLSEKSDSTFLITNSQVANNIYGFVGDKSDLRCIDCKKGIYGYISLIKLLNNNCNYDFIELPPIDSLNEYIYSKILLYFAKKRNIRTGYFWEKWESPKNYQPISRRIKNRILGFVAYNAYKDCDIIFSTGIKNKEYFIRYGVPEYKIRMIPDSTEVPLCSFESIREKLHISNNQIIILYFGRIIKQKGLDILIKALAELDPKYRNNVSLIVAGDGPFKEYCESLVRDLRLSQVYFTGSINPQARFNYFKQCDIFVHPGTFYKGRTDVWGLTLNEAIICDKTIISTNAVGSSYELIKFDNGLMVEAGNIDSMKEGLLTVIRNIEYYKDRSIEIDREIKKVYSTDNMANEYLRFINELLRF